MIEAKESKQPIYSMMIYYASAKLKGKKHIKRYDYFQWARHYPHFNNIIDYFFFKQSDVHSVRKSIRFCINNSLKLKNIADMKNYLLTIQKVATHIK